MRADWIPSDYLPREAGVYLVTTCNDRVVIDRFDGECWGKCRPTVKGKGHYKLHKAWSVLPFPYREE